MSHTLYISITAPDEVDGEALFAQCTTLLENLVEDTAETFDAPEESVDYTINDAAPQELVEYMTKLGWTNDIHGVLAPADKQGDRWPTHFATWTDAIKACLKLASE